MSKILVLSNGHGEDLSGSLIAKQFVKRGYSVNALTIVGMGTGTIYSTLGGTHLTQEDISIARSIPNMQIIAPSDPLELKEAIRYCCKNSKSQIIGD